MLPTKNTIYKDHGSSTTDEINNIIIQSSCIIVVSEESSRVKYHNLEDITDDKIYQIAKKQLLADKIQITIRKFAVLVRQGIIKKECKDIIIFRIEKCNREFVNLFKVFYIRNLCIRKKNPLILTFLKFIVSEDVVYLHSYLCEDIKGNEITTKEKENSITNVFASPHVNETANEYVYYKNILQNALNDTNNEAKSQLVTLYDKIIETEQVTYKYGLYLLREYYKRVRYSRSNNINNIDNIDMLLTNDMKYRKLLHIIKNFEKYEIFIKTKNQNLMSYITAQVSKSYLIHAYNENIALNECKHGILILYDGDFISCANEFHKTFIFHDYHKKEHFDLNNITNQIENIDFNQKENNFCSFLKYKDEKIVGLTLPNSDAFVDFEYAYVMLQMIISLICGLFRENYLIFKTNVIKSQYKEKNNDFLCSIILPPFHDNFTEIFGLYYSDKKSAQRDTALNAIEFLYRNKFIDENLFPVTETLIYRNTLYYYRICRYFRLEPVLVKNTNLLNDQSPFDFIETRDKDFVISKYFLSYVRKRGLINDRLNTILNLIVKKNLEKPKTEIYIPLPPKPIKLESPITHSIIDSDESDDISSYVKAILPECLKKYESISHCYYFEETDSFSKNIKDSIQLGICTSSSFKESLTYKNVNIKFLKTIKFDANQLESLIFLQVLIFVLYFKKVKENKIDGFEYNYLIIPLKNYEIDFEFLLNLKASKFLTGNVYQNMHNENLLKSNFIYNPFINKFYIYAKPCDNSLHDKEMLGDSVRSYKNYYEEKYKTKLLLTEGENLLFYGYIFEKKCSTIPCILSAEIMQITSINIDFGKDFEKLKMRIHAFEKASLAFQFKQMHNINMDTQFVIQCFSAAEDEYPNYECLEFLGDCVLKYVAVKYIFLTNVSDITTFIKLKDRIVSNDSLLNVAKELEITKYFSFVKYCDSLFQPPSIFNLINKFEPDLKSRCEKYIDYFSTHSIFKSSNATLHCEKFKYHGNKVKGAKTYSDIVEALIGASFITDGFLNCEEFIYNIGVFNSTFRFEDIQSKKSIIPNFSTINKNFPDIFADICQMKEYRGFLSLCDIKGIENILNYKFKDPGLIEKAMIHPSSNNNILGSVYFNKLEFLGDAIIDIVVTVKIYNKNSFQNPESLHSKRKSLVNNFTLARVLFMTKLIKYLHICFKSDYIEKLYETIKYDGGTINKAFGDVFESVCGAIMVDMQFNIEEFQRYFLTNLYKFLEKSADNTR